SGLAALLAEPGLEFFLHVGLRDLGRPAVEPRLAAVVALDADERRRRVGKNFAAAHRVPSADRAVIRAKDLAAIVADLAPSGRGDLASRFALSGKQPPPLAVLKAQILLTASGRK